MKIQQLIYTSSKYSVDDSRIGLSNLSGFHVYSCSDGLTHDEIREVIKYISYDIPPSLRNFKDFPKEQFDPSIPEYFPVSFSFFRLSSVEKYVIMQTNYSGCEYTKRMGNFFCHAFLIEDPSPDFNPMLYYRSPSFKSFLTPKEYETESVKHLPDLEEIEKSLLLPVEIISAQAALSSFITTGKSLLLVDAPIAITSYIFALFDCLPFSIVCNMSFQTYAQKISIKNEKPLFRIIGTPLNDTCITEAMASKYTYSLVEPQGLSVQHEKLALYSYLNKNGLDFKECLIELQIDNAEKLIAFLNAFASRSPKDIRSVLSLCHDSNNRQSILLFLLEVFIKDVTHSEFKEFWSYLEVEGLLKVDNEIVTNAFCVGVENLITPNSFLSLDDISLISKPEIAKAVKKICMSKRFVFALNDMMKTTYLSRLELLIKLYYIFPASSDSPLKFLHKAYLKRANQEKDTCPDIGLLCVSVKFLTTKEYETYVAKTVLMLFATHNFNMNKFVIENNEASMRQLFCSVSQALVDALIQDAHSKEGLNFSKDKDKIRTIARNLKGMQQNKDWSDCTPDLIEAYYLWHKTGEIAGLCELLHKSTQSGLTACMLLDCLQTSFDYRPFIGVEVFEGFNTMFLDSFTKALKKRDFDVMAGHLGFSISNRLIDGGINLEVIFQKELSEKECIFLEKRLKKLYRYTFKDLTPRENRGKKNQNGFLNSLFNKLG